MKRDPAGASSDVFRLFLVDTFVGNAMIPVFSIFLPILAIVLGADPLQVGLVGGTANAVYSFMPFIMGRFSDKRKSREFFVVVSLGLLTSVSLLYSISSSPTALIVLRILEGTGWSMFWPTIEAEMTLGGQRDPRKTLSQFNAVWSGASASGPIIGSLATLLLSLHSAFLVTAGILFFTLVPNAFRFFRRREEKAVGGLMSSRQSIGPEGEPQKKRGKAMLRRVLATNALVAVSFSVLITFYGPYARSVGISIATIGAVTFMYGFLRFIFFYLVTRDRFRDAILRESTLGRVAVTAAAVTCLSSLLFLTHTSTLLVSVVVFALVGTSQTFVIIISQVLTIAEASAEKKGTRAGVLESTTGIGASLGPIVGGILSGSSLTNAFIVPGISFVGVMILMEAYHAVRRPAMVRPWPSRAYSTRPVRSRPQIRPSIRPNSRVTGAESYGD